MINNITIGPGDLIRDDIDSAAKIIYGHSKNKLYTLNLLTFTKSIILKKDIHVFNFNKIKLNTLFEDEMLNYESIKNYIISLKLDVCLNKL